MELKKTNDQRPWQGTALGILSILSMIVFGIVILLLIMTSLGADVIINRLSQMSGSTSLNDYHVASMGIKWAVGATLLTIIPFWIVQFFVTRGIFKGTRWTIIYSTVLTSLFVLGQINMILLPPILLAFGINCFMLYLEIVCLKHPYYKN